MRFSSPDVKANPEQGHVNMNSTIDEDIQQLLELVNLGHLYQRYNSLDACEDWFSMLSGGEKQRLCFARYLMCTATYHIWCLITSR